MFKKINLRKKKKISRKKEIILLTSAYILCISISVLLAWMIQPTINNITYTMQEEGTEPVAKDTAFPFSLSDAPKSNIDVTFTLHTGILRPALYHLLPDDCLNRLIINSEAVDNDSIPVCDYTNGTTVDLSSYLENGPNIITAIIGNNGGATRFSISPSSKDPIFWLPFVVFTISTLVFSGLMARYLSMNRKDWTLYILFGTAIALRVFYTSITPYWVRGHDTDGHIEYIEHLATHATLPNPSEGWEYWQPPLYYTVNAVVYAGATFLNIERELTLKLLQYFSVLLSAGTLFCLLLIAKELFPQQKKSGGAALFFAVCALLPSFIFLSARINNDVLTTFLSVLSILLLLYHWKKAQLTTWLLLTVILGLGLLSKNTAMLTAAASFGVLLFHPVLPWKQKLLQGLTGIFVIGMVAGWFSVYRVFHPAEQEYMVGNIGSLNSALRVENSLSTVTIFNPLEMVKHPFNEPWSDAGRRQYFWEYWYRSSYFGEFMYDKTYFMLAVWVLISSFTLIPLGIFGLWNSVKNNNTRTAHLPLLILFSILLLGALAFRVRYPYASSQDFRYVLPVIIPWYFFVVRGSLSFKEDSVARTVSTSLIIAHTTLCAMFVLSL